MCSIKGRFQFIEIIRRHHRHVPKIRKDSIKYRSFHVTFHIFSELFISKTPLPQRSILAWSFAYKFWVGVGEELPSSSGLLLFFREQNNNTFTMADAKADKKDKGEKKGSHPADPIFDSFDKDKSGALDKKEVEAALGALAKAQGIYFFHFFLFFFLSFPFFSLPPSLFFSLSLFSPLSHPSLSQARRSLTP